ncbi:MAG: hypothetical protein IJ511_04810 [Bacteroides sp.]|nr:hypothetical protein [Bacteroides sp.]
MRFIFILGVLTFMACTNRQEENKEKQTPRLTRLQRADTLCRHFPDSALALLNSLKATELPTRADTMHRLLIATEARMKLRQHPEASDTSLLNNLSAYYEIHRNPSLHTRTLLLQSNLYAHLHLTEQQRDYSIKAFLHAEQAAEARLLLQTAEQMAWSCAGAYVAGRTKATERPDTLSESNSPTKPKSEQALLEPLLLRAWKVADSLGNYREKLAVLIPLNAYYAHMGRREQCLHFAAEGERIRREEGKPQWVISSAWASVYERLNETDSARYYREKSRNEQQKQLLEDGQQKAADKYTATQRQQATAILIITLTGVILLALLLLMHYRKRLHHAENRRETAEKEHSAACEALQQHESEALRMKREIALLTPPDEVCTKMESIIHEQLHKAKQTQHMDSADWNRLLLETEKRYPGLALHLSEEFNLNEEEIRLCCLHLTNYPVSHLRFILGYSRATVHRRSKEILGKMHIIHTVHLREALQEYVKTL